MLLRVVGSCCTKLEMVEHLKPTTPNISFVPWLPKHSATMLDPFAHYCQHGQNNSQHCWAKTAWLPFWQTYLRIMLYWKFRKIKPLLFKIIIILLIIIIYNISIAMFYLFQILSSLLVSPYFFLDVLYVHELPSELNLCKVSSIRLILILSMNVTVKFSKQVF